jgi:hypothetical protein
MNAVGYNVTDCNGSEIQAMASFRFTLSFSNLGNQIFSEGSELLDAKEAL